MSRPHRRSERTRIAATRAVQRSRNAHRTYGDTAYLVYICVLLAALVGLPVVRAIALSLATPAAMDTLGAPVAVQIVAVLGALACLGALTLGRVRGPLAPRPFTASVLARSDLSPLTAWSRELITAAVQVALSLGALAALAVSGFLVNNVAVGAGVAFIGGAILFALPITAIWLAGQVLGRRGTAVLGAVLSVLLLIALSLPVSLLPASALASLWPGSSGVSSGSIIVLTACAIAALVALPVLLNRLTPLAIEEHAQRWSAMTVMAATGDISGAMDRARSHPSVGRRLHIPFRPPLLYAVLQRTIIGALRTPVRSTVALAALVTAGMGWAWSAGLTQGPHAVPAVGAGLLMFAAMGSFSDGFREAADTAGRPALYGRAPGVLSVLHAPLPLLVAVLVPAAGALAVGADLLTTALVAAIGVVVVAVRAYDSAKGPMPIELMMPVPTPAGDASAIGMWAWQADALLWTGALSFWLSTSGASALPWILAAVLSLVALTVRRLRLAAS